MVEDAHPTVKDCCRSAESLDASGECGLASMNSDCTSRTVFQRSRIVLLPFLRIELFVKESGKTLLQIIDDGCGMSPTDARMAFERHATSKIKTANDLFSIRTMGFRGEALASIAAISHVEIKTRRKEDEVGSHVVELGERRERPEVGFGVVTERDFGVFRLAPISREADTLAEEFVPFLITGFVVEAGRERDAAPEPLRNPADAGRPDIEVLF